MLKQFDSGKSFTVKELASLLKVSEKTVYRYLNTLKAAHVPVSRDPVTLRYSLSEGYKVGISNDYEEDDIWFIDDTSVEAIMMVEHNGHISYWNRAAEKIFGYNRDDVLGKDVIKLLTPKRFHKENYEILRRLERNNIATDEDVSNEYVCVMKNGEEILARLSFLSIMLKGKRKLIVIIREVDSLSSSRAGRSIEERTRQLSEYTSDGVLIVDLNNNIAYWNSSAEAIFNYKKAEVIGESIFSRVLPEEENKDLVNVLDELQTKKHSMNVSRKIKLVAKRRDGKRLSLTAYMLFKRDKIKNSSFLIVRIISVRLLV
jgi:methyl-accepting chemotaxis protein